MDRSPQEACCSHPEDASTSDADGVPDADETFPEELTPRKFAVLCVTPTKTVPQLFRNASAWGKGPPVFAHCVQMEPLDPALSPQKEWPSAPRKRRSLSSVVEMLNEPELQQYTPPVVSSIAASSTLVRGGMRTEACLFQSPYVERLLPDPSALQSPVRKRLFDDPAAHFHVLQKRGRSLPASKFGALHCQALNEEEDDEFDGLSSLAATMNLSSSPPRKKRFVDRCVFR